MSGSLSFPPGWPNRPHLLRVKADGHPGFGGRRAFFSSLPCCEGRDRFGHTLYSLEPRRTVLMVTIYTATEEVSHRSRGEPRAVYMIVTAAAPIYLHGRETR